MNDNLNDRDELPEDANGAPEELDEGENEPDIDIDNLHLQGYQVAIQAGEDRVSALHVKLMTTDKEIWDIPVDIPPKDDGQITRWYDFLSAVTRFLNTGGTKEEMILVLGNILEHVNNLEFPYEFVGVFGGDPPSILFKKPDGSGFVRVVHGSEGFTEELDVEQAVEFINDLNDDDDDDDDYGLDDDDDDDEFDFDEDELSPKQP